MREYGGSGKTVDEEGQLMEGRLMRKQVDKCRQTPTILYNIGSSKFARPERIRICICTIEVVPRELRQYALVDMILHQGTTQKANGGYLGHLATTPSFKPCTHYSVYLGLHQCMVTNSALEVLVVVLDIG